MIKIEPDQDIGPAKIQIKTDNKTEEEFDKLAERFNGRSDALRYLLDIEKRNRPNMDARAFVDTGEHGYATEGNTIMISLKNSTWQNCKILFKKIDPRWQRRTQGEIMDMLIKLAETHSNAIPILKLEKEPPKETPVMPIETICTCDQRMVTKNKDALLLPHQIKAEPPSPPPPQASTSIFTEYSVEPSIKEQLSLTERYNSFFAKLNLSSKTNSERLAFLTELAETHPRAKNISGLPETYLNFCQLENKSFEEKLETLLNLAETHPNLGTSIRDNYDHGGICQSCGLQRSRDKAKSVSINKSIEPSIASANAKKHYAYAYASNESDSGSGDNGSSDEEWIPKKQKSSKRVGMNGKMVRPTKKRKVVIPFFLRKIRAKKTGSSNNDINGS